MNRRQAKYWLVTIFGAIGIIWIWALAGHFLHVENFLWVSMFMISCILSLVGFCILMFHLCEHSDH